MPRDVSSLAKAAIFMAILAASGAAEAQDSAWSGPFGLEQGLTLVEVGKRLNLKPLGDAMIYAADTVPSPEPAFVGYQLIFSSSSGLCAVAGLGPEKTSDGFGTPLRQDFSALKQAINRVHGSPDRDLDQLDEGSKWTDPADYTQGLFSEDRSLLTLWRSTEAKPLSASLNTIALLAHAASPTKTSISVHYRFANNAQCEAEKRALEKQARDKPRATR